MEPSKWIEQFESSVFNILDQFDKKLSRSLDIVVYLVSKFKEREHLLFCFLHSLHAGLLRLGAGEVAALADVADAGLHAGRGAVPGHT